MKCEPLISIVMSVYNEPIGYVDEAIKSILAQTFTEFEFIIILDNPGYQDMFNFLKSKSKQDDRIIFINNYKNVGLAASLNRGIDISKGDYIARMDADDISKPNRLEHEIVYLQSNDYDMVSCLADKIDENGKVWDVITASPVSKNYINEILQVQNIIIHPTVLIKKSVLKKLNGYREFPSCQDYDLWLRMLTEGYKIGILNENLFCFRRHQNSISSNKHYEQILNENYIRKLYNKRAHVGEIDDFSLEDLVYYLHSHGTNDAKKKKHERDCYEEYQKSIKLIKKHQLLRGFCLAFISARGYTVRKSIETSIKARVIKRKYSDVNIGAKEVWE